ncbi:MAG: leucine-rich repeat domain-containing protein [Treponema sp.]|jgi:hypothetical protein|nr:leucine-rich repeat domain-containing protein [Treponema sp.]
MKTMKMMMLVLIAAALALAGCAGTPASGDSFGEKPTDAKYFITEVKDGEVTIVAYVGRSADVVIPQTIDGLPVTVIGTRAFTSSKVLTNDLIRGGYRRASLRSVYIPDGVRVIEKSAFYGNKKLSRVRLPETLVTIEGSAFCMNENLSRIKLPQGLTKIGGGAFRSCALTELVIPDSVTFIGYEAFYGNKIERLLVSNPTVLSMAPNAFSWNFFAGYGKDPLRSADTPAGPVTLASLSAKYENEQRIAQAEIEARKWEEGQKEREERQREAEESAERGLKLVAELNARLGLAPLRDAPKTPLEGWYIRTYETQEPDRRVEERSGYWQETAFGRRYVTETRERLDRGAKTLHWDTISVSGKLMVIGSDPNYRITSLASYYEILSVTDTAVEVRYLGEGSINEKNNRVNVELSSDRPVSVFAIVRRGGAITGIKIKNDVVIERRQYGPGP